MEINKNFVSTPWNSRFVMYVQLRLTSMQGIETWKNWPMFSSLNAIYPKNDQKFKMKLASPGKITVIWVLLLFNQVLYFNQLWLKNSKPTLTVHI